MSACFNTQPPEGGWFSTSYKKSTTALVSTHSRLKAAGAYQAVKGDLERVSTHSRLKAAGNLIIWIKSNLISLHTQPPEGGWEIDITSIETAASVSTHSRLKAAGFFGEFSFSPIEPLCFNTQPPEGGWRSLKFIK